MKKIIVKDVSLIGYFLILGYLFCLYLNETTILVTLFYSFIFFVIIYSEFSISDTIFIENNHFVFEYSFLFKRKKVFELSSIIAVQIHKSSFRRDQNSIIIDDNNGKIKILFVNGEDYYLSLKKAFEDFGIIVTEI
jgi:hypothetical protein